MASGSGQSSRRHCADGPVLGQAAQQEHGGDLAAQAVGIDQAAERLPIGRAGELGLDLREAEVEQQAALAVAPARRPSAIARRTSVRRSTWAEMSCSPSRTSGSLPIVWR